MDQDTKLLNLALDIGEIMIINGAETFRVKDTMRRILETSGREKIEATALVTVLIVTLPRDDKGPLSMMRAIHSRTVNFRKVCEANEVSRAFVSGRITLDEARDRLDDISHEKAYNLPVRVICYGLIAGCFSFMSSRSALDGFVAQLIGMLLYLLNYWLETKKVPYFFAPFLGGMLAAFCACGLHPLFPGTHTDTIIIGALIPLLPGVTFSKAIRDILEGSIISGYTRFVEAVLTACFLAGGVGMVLSYFI